MSAWYVHEIAYALGVDNIDWVYQRPSRYALDTSKVTTREGLENLFRDARARGLRASRTDLLRFILGFSMEQQDFGQATPTPVPAALEPSTETSRAIHDALAQHNEEQKQHLANIASCISDLLAIVAAQQREIDELRGGFTLTRVHTAIGAQASEHLQNSLSAAARLLNGRAGEVEVKSVVQKGSISLHKASTSGHQESSNRQEENSRASKVDVKAELNGVLGKIAGAKLGVGVDTSCAQRRLDDLAHEEQNASTESFNGTFEIHHDGVRIRIENA